MKIILRSLVILIGLCAGIATTTSFGQDTVITWSNLSATFPPGGNFGRTSNWIGGDGIFPPAPRSDTICKFDGLTPGDLLIYSADGINGGGSGNPIGADITASGMTLFLTSNQIGSVTFYATNFAVGMGFNKIQVDSGAGKLILGDNNPIAQLIAALRPSSGTHIWMNNSTNPIIINPTFQIQAGGGTSHRINFQGSGNFYVTNNLRYNNGVAGSIQSDNTGTWIWTAGGSNDRFNDSGINSLVLNAGTLIVKSNGLLAITPIGTLTNNATLLKLDAAATAQDTFAFPIHGNGPIQVNSGKWTFASGASTFMGTISLTGGELIANGAENPGASGPLGVGGLISFTGGTLGYGANNNFDYSPRFDTATGQDFRIDTSGQNVAFTNAIGGAGNTVTEAGSGTLTMIGASTYTGVTTINGGRLIFRGPKSGTADIIVANGGALGVTATNLQVTPSTLALTNATLEFNGVNSATTPLIAAGTLSAVGQVIINVNSGNFAVGQSYPLISWTSGAAPDVTLGFLSGAFGTLTTNGNTIKLNISTLGDNWSGTVGGNWTTANNWLSGGVLATYADPNPVVFDDSAAGTTSVTVNALVQPGSVIFNNSTLSYTIASTTGNGICGATSLTKNGTGALTLAGGANAYTGSTIINAGMVTVSSLTNGGFSSDIGASGNAATNLLINGGTLQYTGGKQDIDRAFTIGTRGGSIDASGTGALSLSRTGPIGLSDPGARVLTLTGDSTDTNTLAAALSDQGGSSALTKNGPGLWILTGTNNYSGVTTIGNGILQVGAGTSSGSLGSGNVINNGSLRVNRTGTLTIVGVISGGGSVVKDGTGTLILTNISTYTGGTTVNAGTLQIGIGGATGALAPNSPITNNSKITFNTTGAFSYTGNAVISGTGNVVVTSSGTIKATAANTYTGWTFIDTNATFQPCEGTQGAFVSSVVTNLGTLKLVRQDQGVFGYSNNIVGSGKLLKDVNNNNENDVTLTGTNTYTGGTIIAGGGVVLGDGITPNSGSIVGNVLFTNSPTAQDDRRYLEFNRPDSFTFTGNIRGLGGSTTGGTAGNAGQVIQLGAGVLTLTGTNTYLGGTMVSNGAIQIGAGGASGSLGGGAIIDFGRLIFNRSNILTVTNLISGSGSVVQQGSGTLTLSGSNTITGSTTVSNGTLVVTTSVGGDLNVNGGTFAPGGLSAVGSLHVGGHLNIAAGTVLVSLNKALAQSNSFVAADLSILCTGGALRVTNVGPNVAVGDKFTLFNQPVVNGALMTVTGARATWANNLAVDGSVSVVSVAPLPVLNLTNNGTSLQFSWTDSFSNFKLQTQTNLLATNWSDYPGGGTSPVTVPIDPTLGTAFFRLVAIP
jgi:autotransporter-associated beta strand protein